MKVEENKFAEQDVTSKPHFSRLRLLPSHRPIVLDAHSLFRFAARYLGDDLSSLTPLSFHLASYQQVCCDLIEALKSNGYAVRLLLRPSKDGSNAIPAYPLLENCFLSLISTLYFHRFLIDADSVSKSLFFAGAMCICVDEYLLEQGSCDPSIVDVSLSSFSHVCLLTEDLLTTVDGGVSLYEVSWKRKVVNENGEEEVTIEVEHTKETEEEKKEKEAEKGQKDEGKEEEEEEGKGGEEEERENSNEALDKIAEVFLSPLSQSLSPSLSPLLSLVQLAFKLESDSLSPLPLSTQTTLREKASPSFLAFSLELYSALKNHCDAVVKELRERQTHLTKDESVVIVSGMNALNPTFLLALSSLYFSLSETERSELLSSLPLSAAVKKSSESLTLSLIFSALPSLSPPSLTENAYRHKDGVHPLSLQGNCFKQASAYLPTSTDELTDQLIRPEFRDRWHYHRSRLLVSLRALRIGGDGGEDDEIETAFDDDSEKKKIEKAHYNDTKYISKLKKYCMFAALGHFVRSDHLASVRDFLSHHSQHVLIDRYDLVQAGKTKGLDRGRLFDDVSRFLIKQRRWILTGGLKSAQKDALFFEHYAKSIRPATIRVEDVVCAPISREEEQKIQRDSGAGDEEEEEDDKKKKKKDKRKSSKKDKKGKDKEKDKEEKKKKKAPKKGSKAAQKLLSKKDTLIESNKNSAWEEVFTTTKRLLKGEPSVESVTSFLSKQLRLLAQTAGHTSVRHPAFADLLVYRIIRGSESLPPAQLLVWLSDLFRRYGYLLTADSSPSSSREDRKWARSKTSALLSALKHIPQLHALCEAAFGPEDKKKNKKSKSGDSNPPTRVSHSRDFHRFQLEECGHLLPRVLSSRRDPRVDGFWPDKWQRDVLDLVDDRSSVLVVAPTSSGKTFISYYVCESVLNAKDQDGWVILQAPTKALVDQMAAEIIQKYKGKDLTVGRFTREHQDKIEEADVLIVVPQTFDILLHSAHPVWRHRMASLRYAVLDEVHMMQDPEGSDVWQRVVSQLDCPIIALSATVSDPLDLQSYLSRCLGDKVALVEHKQRYSSLRLAMFNSSQSIPVYTEGLHTDPLSLSSANSLSLSSPMRNAVDTATSSASSFIDLHAIYLLCLTRRPGPHASNAIANLPDVSLDGRACVRLFDALDTTSSSISAGCSPWDVFQSEDKFFLTQDDVKTYSDLLFTRFWSLYSSPLPESNALALRVLRYLSPTPKVERPTLSAVDVVFNCLVHLHAAKRTPVIVFVFDRRIAEYLAFQVHNRLADMQKEWENSEKGKKFLEAFEEAEGLHKELSALETASRDTNPTVATPALRRKVEVDQRLEELAKITCNGSGLERFSFRRPHNKAAESDVEYWRNRVLWRGTEHEKLLMSLSARGVGVHHAGVSVKLRSMTEHLFRLKDLGVVFATSTLTHGINMPCKTVVLAQKSTFLTPTVFKQMAGRAGRRGVDSEGHVVMLPTMFNDYDVSKLAFMKEGVYKMPLNVGVSVLLRSLVVEKSAAAIPVSSLPTPSLSSASTKGKNGLRAPKKLTSVPGSSSLSRHLERSMAYHQFEKRALSLTPSSVGVFPGVFQARAMLDFCLEEGLVTSDGVAVGWAGLLSRLHYQEPHVFSLSLLLDSPSFTKLCSEFSGSSDDYLPSELAIRVLMILGRFINPLSVPRSKRIVKSISMGVLPPLSEVAPEIEREMEERRKHLCDVTVGYSRLVAEAVKKEQKERKGDGEKDQENFSDSAPLSSLSSQLSSLSLPASSVIHPHYAARGVCDDNVSSVSELLRFAGKKDLVVKLPTYETTGLVNSYAVDFFKHGQADPSLYMLPSSSHLYDVVKEFTKTLAILDTCLQQYLLTASVSSEEEQTEREKQDIEDKICIQSVLHALSEEYKKKLATTKL